MQDTENTTSSGTDVVVSKFGKHPAVNSLVQTELQMIMPRPVGAVDLKNPPSDAPQVTELAFSGDDSKLTDEPAAPPRSYPLMAAVEQKNSAGVANSRGTTRILVAGDSIFLDNQVIEGGLVAPIGIFSATPSTGCWTGPSCWKASGRGPSRNSGYR